MALLLIAYKTERGQESISVHGSGENVCNIYIMFCNLRMSILDILQ